MFGRFELSARRAGFLQRPERLLSRHPKGCGPGLSADRDRHYAKVAFAKLYDRSTLITAAEILNDRVAPLYDEHGNRLSHMLTDRGTELPAYPCGSSKSSARRGFTVCIT